MPLPAGVTYAALGIGPIFDGLSRDARFTASVRPVFGGSATHLAWTATGETLVDATVSIAARGTLTINLPHTDQAGWVDGSGNAVTLWHYLVRVASHFVMDGRLVEHSITKQVQPLVGQATLAWDLLEDGTTADPEVTPGGGALALDGLTDVATADASTGEALVFDGAAWGPSAAAVVLTNDARLTDARTPTAHAASHASAGSDPITVAQSQVTNLTTDLGNKQAADSDLTALAGLSATGVIARTGPGAAAARTVTGTTGQVDVANGDGVSGNPTISLAAQAINAQTGTSYTLVAGDAWKLVTLSNAGAITCYLPQDSDATFAVGTRVDFLVLGAGMVTWAAGAGATVNGTPSLVSRAQYGGATAIKRAANTWAVVGDLATP